MSSHAGLGDQRPSTSERQAALSEFLRSRRARLKPEDVGLVSYGHRRVPGLRREELAQLAGVSFNYYVRLEQGYSDGISTSVLDSVARVLKLTEDERDHLFQLARPAGPSAPPPTAQRLRPEIQNLIDALGVPAFVNGPSMYILGWNRLAATVFGELGDLPPEERNWARLMFLSATTRERFVDIERREENTVRILRTHHGLYPDDPRLACLVAELSQQSERFQRLWVHHDVGCRNTGPLRMRHPLVGEFDLTTELLLLPNDPDQRLQTYHAEPGSASEKALRVLAGWSDPSGGPAVDGAGSLRQAQA